MAEVDEKKAEEGLEVAKPEAGSVPAAGSPADFTMTAADSAEALSTDKYVFAAFFVAGIGVAFLIGKILNSIWNYVAEEAWAVRQVPVLLRYTEDERPMYTMAAGGVVGLIVLIQCLRNERLRRWADDVALELSKVTWPKKETVTNGTIVVIAAGLFATVYIGLLDRLWGFVTMLVYGA